jgi:cyclopropane fatty-acyl-phospholipid synthase-like methyltransferase
VSQKPNPWDTIFRESGRVFLQPQEDMPSFADLLHTRGATTLLDLGSGTGRHIIFFARHGFTVSGFDESTQGIAQTQEWLTAEELSADLRVGNMLAGLPYADGSFDAVISVQVIHHGTIAAVRQLIAEIDRVLKPGGVVFVSVTGRQDQGTEFDEIEPGTLVPRDGKEAGLPHHYFTPEELRAAFGRYDVLDMHVDRTYHHCLTAIKPGG